MTFFGALLALLDGTVGGTVGLIIGIVSGIVLGTVLFFAYASGYIGSQIYTKTYCQSVTSDKVLCLTFDDGPDSEHTPEVLEVLRKHNIKATFFCIGKKINASPEIVKQLVDEGHMIGIHTYFHTLAIPFFRRKNIIKDFNECNDAFEKACGKRTSLFRPPCGVTNPRIAYATRKLGLKTVGWSIRTFDTNGDGVERIVKRVKHSLAPGGIILMHDRMPDAAKSLEAIIQLAQAEGYSFVNLDTLFLLETQI